MVRLASVGLLLAAALLLAAEPKPRADADGRELPAEALVRLLPAKADERPQAPPKTRWPQFQFSADGKTVTRIGGGTAITWDTTTGKETARLLPDKLLTAGASHTPLIADMYQRNLAAKSPDGKAEVLYSNPTVQQMRFTITMKVNGKVWPNSELEKRMVGVLQVAFTPDGKYALAQLDQEHLHIWDVTGDEHSGDVITFATPGPSGYRQVPLMHVAPDSKRVALVESDPKMQIVQREAMRFYRWQIGVYTLDTRQRTGGISGAGVLTAAEWSADASLIAGAGRMAAGDDGDAGFAFVATSNGTFVLSPVELASPATACALSPDCRTLAVGTAGEVRLYEVRTGQLRHTFRPAGGDVLGLKFHPHGAALYSESADGTIYSWDLRGELTKPPEPDTASFNRLWADLTAEDAGKAFAAIRQLAAHPAKALPDLKGRVAGQKRPTAAEIAAKVGQLNSRVYAERAAAEKELKAMGRLAHAALKSAVAADSSPELHARANRLLAVTVTPATLRVTRLVEAVEWAGTAEAKALLTAWATDAGPELASEAEAALARWRK